MEKKKNEKHCVGRTDAGGKLKRKLSLGNENKGGSKTVRNRKGSLEL